MKYKILVIAIFIFGLAVRTYNLDWDNGQHLHPDERFLTMVSNDIALPSSIAEYFNTSTSPLNPYNYKQYQFFVYGTFPLFLTKVLAVALKLDSYDSIHMLGRVVSAFFDSLVILVLYKVFDFFKQKKVGIFAAFLYATTVLPVQLSHFYAVDTYLSFLLFFVFFLLLRAKSIAAGLFFGLALSCKISGIYFLPVVLFLIFITNKQNFFVKLFQFTTFAFLTFRIFQPYVFIGLFKINPLFIENIKTLRSFNDPQGWFPPAVQWISKTPILFPAQNIILWGAGVGLILLAIVSLKSKKTLLYKISCFWIIFLILVQGKEFAHTMRYFLPIYPYLCILASIGFLSLKSNLKYVFLIMHLVWFFSFLNIYTQNHSRVTASDWIYKNFTKDKIITYEYWDDPLPLNINRQINDYKSVQLAPYDRPDTENKLEKSKQADYIISSSNRLWGSIPKVPDKYPYTSLWYKKLFSTSIHKKFVSYPGFRLPVKNCYYFGPTDYPAGNSWFEIDQNCRYPGVYLRDDMAEEAFTVYDHPQVVIFANRR